MKNESTNKLSVLLPIFIFCIISFGSVIGNPPPEPTCPCGNFIVKFEWNGSQFVPEGGDPHGITITGWTTKPGEPSEPMTVNWTSADWWICAVMVKHGNTHTNQTFPSPGVSSGTSATSDNHAISHIDFCSDAVLPVEMTSFSVFLKNSLAQLEWETATEVNNYGFEIQRASEVENWNKIGFVEGHGNSNSPKHYSFSDPSITISGKYSYRLKQIDIDGRYEYSDAIEIDFSAPLDYKLNQNYPNPFNPTTTISYSIPQRAEVKLIVYNLFGEEVTRLVNETKEAGAYSVTFNAENIASGMYFYTIETENFIETRKFILLK